MHLETFKDHNGNDQERLHPSVLDQVEKIVHHPTSIQFPVFISCSCGYSGQVLISENSFGSDEDGAECPNCHSKTVHPKLVTEKATTHVHFRSGEKRIFVASQKAESTDVQSVNGLTEAKVAEIVKQSIAPYTETLEQLKNLLASQPKVVTPVVSDSQENK